MRRLAVTLVLVAAMVAGACTSAAEGEAVTIRDVGASEAFERLPLDNLPSNPLAAGDRFVWVSDFKRIAVYHPDDRQWVIRNLPTPVSRNGGMTMATTGGQAVVLEQVCRARCDDGVPVELHLFSIAPDGRTTSLELPGVSAVPPRGGLLRRLRTGRKAAVFAVSRSEGWFVVTATATGATTELVPGRYQTLCADDGGWVGVELVAQDAPGAVPLNQPEASHVLTGQEPGMRVVAGAALTDLAPVEVPAGARATLERQFNLLTACRDEGIALVGSRGSAWEFSGGTWSEQRSEVLSEGPSAASSYAVERLPDGILDVVTEGGVVERTAEGVWRRRDGWVRRVDLGDQMLSYRFRSERGSANTAAPPTG